jgi:hypothetical protein
MVLRDWSLESCGALDKRIGGRPVYPYQPDGIWESLAITKERDFSYPTSAGSDLYRRSLYTFWRRTVGPANMFDASSRQACKVRMTPTSTPLHALTTLNDPTWVEAARLLAGRALRHSGQLRHQLAFAFRLVTCRQPANKELDLLCSAFEKQQQIFAQDPEASEQLQSIGSAATDQSLDTASLAAMSSVCLMILNLDESLTRE